MKTSICGPTPPAPRPAWVSATGSWATTPPGPIRLSVIGHLTRSTHHRRNWGSPRHRAMWQHDRHSSPQRDRPELRNLSRLSKLRGPSQTIADDVKNGTTSCLFYSLAFLYQTPGPILDTIKAVTARDELFVYGISEPVRLSCLRHIQYKFVLTAGYYFPIRRILSAIGRP